MREGCDVLKMSENLPGGCEVAKLTTRSRGEFQCSTFNQSTCTLVECTRVTESLIVSSCHIECLRFTQSLCSVREVNSSWIVQLISPGLRILYL